MPGTGYEESFRNQAISGGYPEADAFPAADEDGQTGYPYGHWANDVPHEPDTDDGSYRAYEPDDTYEEPEPGPVSNPQFEQVYHQPYNYTAPEPEDDVVEYGGQAGYPDSPGYAAEEPYRAPALEDDQRAAYQADFQRNLARGQADLDEPDEPDDHPEDDAYARAGGYDATLQTGRRSSAQRAYSQHTGTEPAPRQPTPAAPPVPRFAPTRPPAATPSLPAQPVSAAPPSFSFSPPAPIPAQRAPRPAAAPQPQRATVPTAPQPRRATVPAARLPTERIPPRREPQRRPAPAARGFVPSQDRVGTAREVMTYLARRPWLQLDVVDIILGTQFDRDDVAHALIVLQQTGRIRSHLRGDRVCYSYAVT